MESSIPGISKYATHLSKEFNEMLDRLLPQYNGLNILRVNTFALLNNVYGYPQRYGLTDVMDPCFSGDEQTAGVVCNNPDAYLFWDSIHPTAAVHEILAEKVYVAIENCHKKGQLSLCAQDLDR
jgi:outer membrane lipase/esterase